MFIKYLNYRKLFCNIAYFLILSLISILLLYRIYTDIDFTDEAQNYIKLFYLIRENNIYLYDFNIHQTFLLIIYPILKIVYFINENFLENNLIIITKYIYLLFIIIGFYAYLKSVKNINIFYLLFISLVIIFLFKHFFSLYYDNIVVLGLLYYFLIIYFNNKNLFFLILVNFFIGFGNPALGILIFIISIFNIEKNIDKLRFIISIISLFTFFTVLIFLFGVINIKDLFVSLKQSSEMSNFKIIERPSQMAFILIFITYYVLLRLISKKQNFKKLISIKINFFIIISILFITTSYLIILSKYYNYFFIYLFIFLFSIFLTTQNNNNNYNKIIKISDCSILFLLIQSFISGNSLAKVDLISVSAVPFLLLYFYNYNFEFKFFSKIISIILLFFISYVSFYKSYRTDNFFDKKYLIETRFGDRYVSLEKYSLYNDFKNQFELINFEEDKSLLVIGSAPWIYLIDDITPSTKNLFYDIPEEIFYKYIHDYNIEVKKVISLVDSAEIKKFLLNYNCINLRVKTKTIVNANHQLDRKYKFIKFCSI